MERGLGEKIEKLEKEKRILKEENDVWKESFLSLSKHKLADLSGRKNHNAKIPGYEISVSQMITEIESASSIGREYMETYLKSLEKPSSSSGEVEV